MSSIHLMRCKALPLPQMDAFKPSRASTAIVTDCFMQRPTAKVPRGAVWHIGNTQEIDGGGIFFALGREAILKKQQFNEGRREFEEVEQEQAPFTVGVYDTETQAAGVLVRPGVSLSAREIATKLQVLLESTGIAEEYNTRIAVEPIADPRGFIDMLLSANRVTRFEFDFSLPNPPDDEKFIQRPLKEFGKRVGASEGKASLKGASLDPKPLIDLTRAVAAEGDNVTANVEMVEGGGIERKELTHNPLREPVEPELHESTGAAILRAVRRAYHRVRGENDES